VGRSDAFTTDGVQVCYDDFAGFFGEAKGDGLANWGGSVIEKIGRERRNEGAYSLSLHL